MNILFEQIIPEKSNFCFNIIKKLVQFDKKKLFKCGWEIERMRNDTCMETHQCIIYKYDDSLNYIITATKRNFVLNKNND